MSKIMDESLEARFQKFKDLDESKFKKIRCKISKLPRKKQLLAWKFIISLLNEKMLLFDPHASPDLTPLESFRLHFPKIDVPNKISRNNLDLKFRLQKRTFTKLLRVAKTKGCHIQLRADLYTLLENHFPLGSLWVVKWPTRRGPKSDTVRNLCIFCLVSLFRNSGLTDEKAREHVLDILKLLPNRSLGLDGIRSAYLSGKSLVGKI